ncbi:MAG: hypothetical protein WC781_05265 [Candidatus Pacearchaeota archaeon]|jgi:hypothetical protein
MANGNAICSHIEKENEELKRALALSLNKPLVKKLREALGRINSGDYVSEAEFFNPKKS